MTKSKLTAVYESRPQVSVCWARDDDDIIADRIKELADEHGAENVGGGREIGGPHPQRDEQFEFDTYEQAVKFATALREAFDVEEH